MCLKILFFNVLINISATTDFPSLYVEYISILFIFTKSLKELLINPYFIWLPFFLDYFLNALTILTPFLSVIGTTQEYLLNKSISHNKYLIS